LNHKSNIPNTRILYVMHLQAGTTA